jgi:hypothetical protein
MQLAKTSEMEKLTFLNAGNQFVIINNITFLERRTPGSTIIHFNGGNSLEVSIGYSNLIELIEREIKK